MSEPEIPHGFRVVNLTGAPEYQCWNLEDGPAIVCEYEHGDVIVSNNENGDPGVTVITYRDGNVTDEITFYCQNAHNARVLGVHIQQLCLGVA